MTGVRLRARIANPHLRRMAGNTGWLIGERVFGGLVAITVTVAVARYLGPTQFGVLSYALSFVLLFATLWTLGLSGIVVRDLVREPDHHDEILGTLFALRLVGGAVGIVAIIVAAALVAPDDPTTRLAIAVLAFATLFYAFDGIDFWMQSEVRSRFAVVARSSALALTAGLNLALISLQAPLMAFALAAGLEYALAGIGLVAIYRLLGRSPVDWHPSWHRARDLVSRSWPLMLSGAFYSVNLKVDQLMLGNLAGADAVGTYAAASRISEVWYFVPTAIAASTFPALVLARDAGGQRYGANVQRLYDLVVWLALPLAVAVTLASGSIIDALFGAAYADSVPILMIHIWASPFVFMGAILSRWLIAEDLLRFSLVRHGAGAVVNVAVNLVAIPYLGGVGAAIATLVSYAVASFVVCFAYGPTRPAARQMTLALLVPIRSVASLTAAVGRGQR